MSQGRSRFKRPRLVHKSNWSFQPLQHVRGTRLEVREKVAFCPTVYHSKVSAKNSVTKSIFHTLRTHLMCIICTIGWNQMIVHEESKEVQNGQEACTVVQTV